MLQIIYKIAITYGINNSNESGLGFSTTLNERKEKKMIILGRG